MAVMAIAGSSQAQQGPASQALPLAGETTFIQAGRLLADPESGIVLRDKTLVIVGNLVTEIRDGIVGEGRVVDLRDSFVLPGLIDSHVHLTSQQSPSGRLHAVTRDAADSAMIGAGFARRTLMAGFTTVADLGRHGATGP